MKKVFFVLLSLLLPLALMQPAFATGRIWVHNQTSYSVKVDIVYRTHLCRDDHPTIAPGGNFTVQTGACWINHLTVTGAHGNQCGPGVSALSSSNFDIVEKKYPPHCEVHGRN